jgi:hypothetical protein
VTIVLNRTLIAGGILLLVGIALLTVAAFQ